MSGSLEEERRTPETSGVTCSLGHWRRHRGLPPQSPGGQPRSHLHLVQTQKEQDPLGAQTAAAWMNPGPSAQPGTEWVRTLPSTPRSWARQSSQVAFFLIMVFAPVTSQLSPGVRETVRERDLLWHPHCPPPRGQLIRDI